MNTATMRFRKISTIMRDLNQAGLKMQTVNDLLSMYVGAPASTPYARLSCRLRKLSVSTTKLLPTGHSSQAEM